MKKIIVVAFLVGIQFTNAQVTKNLGDYDAVKVFDKLNVKLISSNENKVVITGNRENDVEVINKNGVLKIRMALSQLLAGDNIDIALYFKNIQSLYVNEGAVISSDAIFKQTAIALYAQEGGQINVSLDVEKVDVKAVSGGIIDLKGKASNQKVNINSGGILNARELVTFQTTVNISAGGNATINASTLVEAKVKAGWDVTIYGNPKESTQKTILGGRITEIK